VNPRIILLDHPDSGCSDDLIPMAAAFQRQAQEHFQQFYGQSCTVVAQPLVNVATASHPRMMRFGTAMVDSDWILGYFSDPDQPGALGYHDMTPTGTPLGKIFPKLDAEDGQSLSVTTSHELLEMLADPFLSMACQGPDGKFWAYEVCDAVEDDSYLIDGILVSNFVTPQYFQPPSAMSGVQLDYLKLVTNPYEVRPGGYMQWNSGAGWNQEQHAEKAPRAYRQYGIGRAHARR
jgi:hypothetical protein